MAEQKTGTKTEIRTDEVATAAIKKAWSEYRATEKYGLLFGKICCQWRDSFRASGRREKGVGVVPILEHLNIPTSTAYWWMNRYEVSIKAKEPSVPQTKAPAPAGRKFREPVEPEPVEPATEPVAIAPAEDVPKVPIYDCEDTPTKPTAIVVTVGGMVEVNGYLYEVRMGTCKERFVEGTRCLPNAYLHRMFPNKTTVAKAPAITAAERRRHAEADKIILPPAALKYLAACKTLGVHPRLSGLITPSILKSIYLDAVKQNHPDTGGDGVKMADINVAYAMVNAAIVKAATAKAKATTGTTPLTWDGVPLRV